MRMNVTPIISKWLDGTYPNNGFIVKRKCILEKLSVGRQLKQKQKTKNF